ncbi:ACP S-malonyltransferase [Streptomyces sp. DH10]|uniref:ACP S-malonyltransferase n=1 Tax=Streptomyces sp. DH10 TaxID=3040121 RepID=UPI002442BCB5|nr:ACP S-malonyltransferase [Streptomyces sp. DH10]MDG9714667.1 ACP S-malonyltransferase [Streptomyces sp. DH10]
MLVLVAPGQGAQTPGFLSAWLDFPGVRGALEAWSDAVGLDLIRYGTEADAEEIRDTAVAQPLLVAAGLASAYLLFDDPAELPGKVGAIAGHSVGEITAASLAGVLPHEEALRLVRTRGLAMAEAAAVTETGMAALLGGDPEVTVPHLEKLGLTPANINGAGQIVAAGTKEQLAALEADKPEGVRKVVALKVAGAFHTHHMAPAVDTLAKAAEALTPGDPKVTYVSNKDGQAVAAGPEVLDRLVGQVANPVRWDLCMETFKELGVTALIEVCPGGTLTGLAKRALPGVKTLALKSPADLDAARELIAEHSA